MATEIKQDGLQRHHVEKAVKSRLFNATGTVDYVIEKINNAYEAGLEAGRGAEPAADAPAEEAPKEEGLFDEE